MSVALLGYGVTPNIARVQKWRAPVNSDVEPVMNCILPPNKSVDPAPYTQGTLERLCQW